MLITLNLHIPKIIMMCKLSPFAYSLHGYRTIPTDGRSFFYDIKSQFDTIFGFVLVKWYNTLNGITIVFKVISIWISIKLKLIILCPIKGTKTQAPQDPGAYMNRNVISEKSSILLMTSSKFHPRFRRICWPRALTKNKTWLLQNNVQLEMKSSEP